MLFSVFFLSPTAGGNIFGVYNPKRCIFKVFFPVLYAIFLPSWLQKTHMHTFTHGASARFGDSAELNPRHHHFSYSMGQDISQVIRWVRLNLLAFNRITFERSDCKTNTYRVRSTGQWKWNRKKSACVSMEKLGKKFLSLQNKRKSGRADIDSSTIVLKFVNFFMPSIR